jgi:acetoin utilization protein AcuB
MASVMTTKPTISEFMTPSPYTIGYDQPMVVAQQLMRDHHIRHLPVLRGGVLAGVVSQRDLYFLETIAGTDPKKVAVYEAMTPDPYEVPPDCPLDDVAEEMAKHRYGCAVVTAPGRGVVGMFTTTDALSAILAQVRKPRRRKA